MGRPARPPTFQKSEGIPGPSGISWLPADQEAAGRGRLAADDLLPIQTEWMTLAKPAIHWEIASTRRLRDNVDQVIERIFRALKFRPTCTLQAGGRRIRAGILAELLLCLADQLSRMFTPFR